MSRGGLALSRGFGGGICCRGMGGGFGIVAHAVSVAISPP